MTKGIVRQFIVTLMNTAELKTYKVNCNNETTARLIAQALYPLFRVLDVEIA